MDKNLEHEIESFEERRFGEEISEIKDYISTFYDSMMLYDPDGSKALELIKKYSH